jgi:hypothetical protein
MAPTGTKFAPKYANRGVKRCLLDIKSPDLLSPCDNDSCSVKLDDMLTATVQKVQNLEEEVNNLRAFREQTEPILRELRGLTYLFQTPKHPDCELAKHAGTLIDSIAYELAQRLRCAKNAVVFNIPDKTALGQVREILLSTCGLDTRIGDCIRLRKRHQKYSCPVLFRFENELQANTFIKSQSCMQEFTQYKSIRVIKDRTPLERSCAAEKKLPTSPNQSANKSKTSTKSNERLHNPGCNTPEMTKLTMSISPVSLDSKPDNSAKSTFPKAITPRCVVDLDQTQETVVHKIQHNIPKQAVRVSVSPQHSHKAATRPNVITKRTSPSDLSVSGRPPKSSNKPTYASKARYYGYKNNQNSQGFNRISASGVVNKPNPQQIPFHHSTSYPQPKLNNAFQMSDSYIPTVPSQGAFFGNGMTNRQPPFQVQGHTIFPTSQQPTYMNDIQPHFPQIWPQVPWVPFPIPPPVGAPRLPILYPHAAATHSAGLAVPPWMPPLSRGISPMMY